MSSWLVSVSSFEAFSPCLGPWESSGWGSLRAEYVGKDTQRLVSPTLTHSSDKNTRGS